MNYSTQAVHIQEPRKHSLEERQAVLEAEMTNRGLDKLLGEVEEKKTKGLESETPYGARLLGVQVAPLATKIQEWVKTKKKDRGVIPFALQVLREMKPELVAALTLKKLLDVISAPTTLNAAAIKVADAIEDEVRFQDFCETEIDTKDGGKAKGKYLFKRTVEKLNERSRDYDHKRTVLVHMANAHGHDWDRWPKASKIALGVRLIELAVEGTGLVEVTKEIEGKDNSIYYVRATEATAQWVKDKIERSCLLMPEYLPTIIPPKDWSGAYGGGYHTNAVRRIPLVKTRAKQYLQELGNSDIQEVLSAVNALQGTPWSINLSILSAVREAWKGNTQIAGLPNREPDQRPPKPDDIETSKESKRSWCRACKAVAEANVRLISKRVQVSRTLAIAEKFKDEPALYYVYQLDFRGRIYAVPMFLNPQGTDLSKALLQFAGGKPLGDQMAADWLAVHGANVWGNDKVNLQDRVAWVQENRDRILNSARAPLDYLWWAEADKPWQFLAFCFEWAGYVREGFQWVSRIPIALDGSCNGLQHFSAMLRDPVGGEATNLVPSDKPQDIYQRVCDRVVEKLKESSDPLAVQWLSFGISRKDTKRCVMTLPYGATLYAFRQFVQDRLQERILGGEANPFGSLDGFGAAGFLARLIHEAISETVVAAVQAMDWLQKAARIVSEEGLAVSWTAPTGFPVVQAYQKFKGRVVDTKLFGKVCKLTIREETPEVDRMKQANGIAPNFVHSLDAASLMFTVNAAADLGITEFAMIHDSYGTTAADTAILAVALREAFKGTYLTDVLASFRDQVSAVLPPETELPPLPSQGSLDLDLVSLSDFFFA